MRYTRCIGRRSFFGSLRWNLCQVRCWIARSFSESPHGCAHQERGSGTVLVLGLILAISVVLLGLMAVGDAVATKERAQDIADVAALAGAQKLRHEGSSVACRQAGELVARHGLSMSSCAVRESHVIVSVRARTHMIKTSVEASARAGPADEPPP